jgi:hypothetical protein
MATIPVRTKRAASASGRPARAKTLDYSRFKVVFRNSDDFVEYLAGYPDTSGLMAYYYRLVPKIDNSLIGLPESSILQTANPGEMQPEFARARWGRGRYMLRLSDANRPKGEQEVCRTWFEFDDPDLASIYDPRSLVVSDPVNAEEVARLIHSGVMVRDAVTGAARVKTEYTPGVMPGRPSPEPAVTAEPELLSKDLLSTLILRLVDRGAQTPKEQLTQTIEVARLLQPAPLAVNPEVAALRVEIAELRTSRGGAAKGTTEDGFDTYLRIQEFLKGQGAGTGSGGSGWVSELLGGIRELLPAVPAIVDGLARLRVQRERAGFSPQRASGAISGPPVGVTIPGGPPGASEGNSARFPVTIQIDLTQGDVFSRLAAVGELALARMDAGMSGFDFASFLCASYTPGGADLFRLMAVDGTTGIMGLLGLHPAVAGASEERRQEIQAWLDDFFTFDPDGGIEGGIETGAAVNGSVAAAA